MANTRKHSSHAAKSEEVLSSADTAKVALKWRRHFQRLIDLREELLRRRSDLVEDARSEQPPFSRHIADAGTDNYDRDLALSIISSEQNALYEVEEALRRIRDGTYGKCEVTGKPIDSGRLEAIPWTRFCADAERQLESQGAVRRTRLGDLGSSANSSVSENEESGS
jgi:DnaK suppressor protein